MGGEWREIFRFPLTCDDVSPTGFLHRRSLLADGAEGSRDFHTFFSTRLLVMRTVRRRVSGWDFVNMASITSALWKSAGTKVLKVICPIEIRKGCSVVFDVLPSSRRQLVFLL